MDKPIYSKMQAETRSPLTQPLEPSEILRVEQLMTKEFHLLPTSQDRRDRERLGAQRSKETLSSIPFYANRAARAAQEGKEWDYWRGLWRSHVNMIHPPKDSSTGEAT